MSVASSQRRKERFGPGRLAFSVQRSALAFGRFSVETKTPLSNSVPSFLRSFCSNAFVPFVSVFGVQRLAFGAVSALRPKPLFQNPFLRFLCYLLFKRSSFPFVSVFGVQRLAFGAWCSALRPKPLFKFRSFVFFVTFCSNALRSLLFQCSAFSVWRSVPGVPR